MDTARGSTLTDLEWTELPPESLKDTGTGRIILRITQGPLENRHAYYDFSPWCPNDRYVLYSAADPQVIGLEYGYDKLGTRSGRAMLFDTATGRVAEVLRDTLYNRHTGCFTVWEKKGMRFYVASNEDRFDIVDLETGVRTPLPSQLRSPSPDDTAYSFNSRNCPENQRGIAIGVCTIETGEIVEVATREQLYELTPNRDEFSVEDMTVGNSKWHPGGEHLLVAMWVRGQGRSLSKPGIRRSFYVISRDGAEKRWLSYFDGHHSWSPAGDQVLFVHQGHAAVCDFAGGQTHVISNRCYGATHPRFSPDGKWIVDMVQDGIVRICVDTGEVEQLARFTQSFDKTHHGTHAHPVWNRAGDKIIYNSAESGLCQMYIIPDANK